jgi:purine-nucleoside phosphorylase
MDFMGTDWRGMAREAASVMRERMREEKVTAPSWAIVLGSGLQGPAYLDPGSPVLDWDFAEIPHLPNPSVPGHRGSIQLGLIEEEGVLVQRGRIHYYECLDFNAVTFSLRLMQELGVERVILTNAAGALNPVFERGDLMLVRDHINLMGGNPLLSHFLDLSDAYDLSLGDLAISLSRTHGTRMEEGILVAVPGPCYETGAELRFFRLAGGDAVSMSVVPEVIFARWLGLRVMAISCITNVWDLRRPFALEHAEVLEAARETAPALEGLIRALIRESGRIGSEGL